MLTDDFWDFKEFLCSRRSILEGLLTGNAWARHILSEDVAERDDV
jgi:hypothetical protein